MYFCQTIRGMDKMKNNCSDVVRDILDNYLEQNNYRKTPERFAILDAVYSFNSYFSIQELSDRLVERCFPVSRATLYNTVRLLMSLRLIVCLRLQQGVRYKACYSDNHCTQVCTVCGKVKEIKIPEIAELVDKTHLKRFRKEGFSMYIYGVCSTCQAMLTRLKNKENTEKQENTNKNKYINKYGKRQS